jgi:hypothetical protein
VTVDLIVIIQYHIGCILLFYFFDQIDLGRPCRQISVGFNGREQISLCHQTPTPTLESQLALGHAVFARQKAKSRYLGIQVILTQTAQQSNKMCLTMTSSVRIQTTVLH